MGPRGDARGGRVDADQANCPEDAQRENIGETPTHVVFIELKEAAAPARGTGSPGPVDR
jgi:hypothetical protein